MDRRDSDFHRWLAEASRDGLWVLDADGTTTYANPAMASLLGRTPEELVGLPASDFLDEAGQAQLRAHLDRLESAAEDDEGADNLEVQLIRSDGTAIWTLASHSPLRADDGRRIGWLHRVTEHTEQRRLLDSLRERERLLAAAQEIASVGSWEWDVPTDTVTWSDQLYRIYNIAPEDFAATYAGFLEFVHPEDRPLVMESVGSIFAGQDEFAFDARVLPRGGGIRWIRGLGRAERGADGSPVTVGGTAQDITDRVHADQAAAEATRRLRLLQTLASAANRTNSLSEAVELAALGLPEFTTWRAICVHTVTDGGALVQRDLSHASPGWRPASDPALAERARLSGVIETAAAPAHEDTHTVVALPVRVGDRVVCVVEMLADEVPPDENSRNLLEQVAVHLGQVAQREAAAAQLAEARDQAMEASRLKSEFLATMSHEIRTPMNGVIGLNDLLLRTDLDAHQRRLAEGLREAGLTLLGIINDILDLSKIEAGRLQLEEVDFDVRAVFDSTAGVLAGPAREQGIELVVACDPDVPERLRGDPVRLGQVLTNLGSNAVKFTDDGEVSIRAHVEDRSEGRVRLRVDVRDTGVGIEPSLGARLFDPFTQADRSTTREHGGTGLGLAISKQLVQALGGTIGVESEPGRGSTFSFTAELAVARDAPAARAGARDPEVLRGRRVLVVDDNETSRLVLVEQLAAWGMLPVAVASAEEAREALGVAAARDEPFDFALLDQLLPDGDGLELARSIGAAHPDAVPTMVLLSSQHHADVQALTAAGAAGCLTKPVRHAELLASLVDPLTAATDAAPAPGSGGGAAQGTGLRILVVEDNPVNQMVAAGLLESSGYVVDVVADGVAAVAALAGAHGYAAVLMDCRMPRLDGFDATRAIREREPPDHRVPVIAMTASVLQGEEERCRAAGMDDFLTKPVDPAQMLRVVARWASGGQPVGKAPAAPVVDLDRMRMLDGLRRDGTSLFERASGRFVENAAEHLAALRDAVDADDADALLAAAHKLKGSATNLGLTALGAAAEALEEVGRTGVTDGARPLLAALEADLERGLAALDEVREHGL